MARFAAAIGLHQGDGNANFNAEEDQGETTDLLEGDKICKPLILCLLVSSADNHCKLFEPRSGLAKHQALIWIQTD